MWPPRFQVTTSRPWSRARAPRCPRRSVLLAPSGQLSAVAGDDRVGDPLAVLLVEDRARVAPPDLVGAGADRLPPELREVVGEDDVARRAPSAAGVAGTVRDLRGRRAHGGGGHVVDPGRRRRAARARRARGDRAGHQPRTRPADPPEPGACRRPAVPVAATLCRKSFHPRAERERCAGALGRGRDRVAALPAAAPAPPRSWDRRRRGSRPARSSASRRPSTYATSAASSSADRS